MKKFNDYDSKQQFKSVLNSCRISSGLKIYDDIEQELDRLWGIEKLAKQVTSVFPTSSDTSYPIQKLEQKISDRLDLTKQLVKAVS